MRRCIGKKLVRCISISKINYVSRALNERHCGLVKGFPKLPKRFRPLKFHDLFFGRVQEPWFRLWRRRATPLKMLTRKMEMRL